MIKKQFLTPILILVILCSAIIIYQIRHPVTKIEFQNLHSYFIKNDVPLAENELNFFIIENKDELESILGYARTMDKPIDEIDFSSEVAIVITKDTTNRDTEIMVDSIYVKERSLYVDYEIKLGQEMSFYMRPLTIVKFKKPGYLLDLYFADQGRIIKKIALGRRSLGSPSSYDDLKKHYTGTFQAVLPCASCSGIDTSLQLKKDGSYLLKKVYEGKTTIPVKEEGRWTISEDLSVIELMASKTYFYIINRDTFEQMSPEGKRINSDLNHELTRQ